MLCCIRNMCFTKCHKAQKKDQHQKIIKGKKAIKRRGKKECFFTRYHPVAQLCCCTTRDHTL